MPDKDAFSDLRKAKEEEFFHNREQALLEKLKQRGVAEQEARKLGEALQVKDERILEDLQALGYDAETIGILFVVPMIAVAWADGEISGRERSLIRELAGVRGDGNSPRQLQQWLETKPPQEFFDRSLRIIGLLLKELSPVEGSKKERELLSSATRIAEASGGILGLGSISNEERKLIERIENEIKSAHSK
jgi:tellurite resistance protein